MCASCSRILKAIPSLHLSTPTPPPRHRRRWVVALVYTRPAWSVLHIGVVKAPVCHCLITAYFSDILLLLYRPDAHITRLIPISYVPLCLVESSEEHHLMTYTCRMYVLMYAQLL